MTLTNTGNTPAYHVNYKTRMAVLPFPMPTDFTFPLQSGPVASEGILGPHQNYLLTAVADQIYPDEDFIEIKSGEGKKVIYVCGTVSYEDAFGIARHTNFREEPPAPS